MIDKRRKIKKAQEESLPSKIEYAVADFLRFNVPTREGKLRGITVTCFFASKAVDALLDSKWASNKDKTEPLFTTRQSCVEYCQGLLQKGLYHHVYRIDKQKDGKDKKPDQKCAKSKKVKKKEEEETKGKELEKGLDKKNSTKKDEDKKKKRKMKLDIHDNQIFADGEEIYAWIYDPTPLKNKVIGLLLVLGAIGICLFPLWPSEVRLGVYYLSIAAACFVGLILSLCIIRMITFVIVWAVTIGKHHFWLLPNLTEDVGFFDSFKPLYDYSINDEKQNISVENAEETVEKEDEERQSNDSDNEICSNKAQLQDTAEKSDSNGYEIVNPEDVQEN